MVWVCGREKGRQAEWNSLRPSANGREKWKAFLIKDLIHFADLPISPGLQIKGVLFAVFIDFYEGRGGRQKGGCAKNYFTRKQRGLFLSYDTLGILVDNTLTWVNVVPLFLFFKLLDGNDSVLFLFYPSKWLTQYLVQSKTL